MAASIVKELLVYGLEVCIIIIGIIIVIIIYIIKKLKQIKKIKIKYLYIKVNKKDLII